MCAGAGGATLEGTGHVVRENCRVMRHSLSVVDEALSTLVECIPVAPGSYDARGAETASVQAEPGVIDQRG